MVTDVEPLRTFIRKEFLYDADASLQDDDELFPDIIDSLGVMEVVDFVEEQYAVEVPEDELLADNFKTLRAIGALIDRHRA